MNYSYIDLENKYKFLLEKRDEIMNECAKNNLSFTTYKEKAKDISEKIFLVSREMRLKQPPILDYGKTWKGETLSIEEFKEKSLNNIYTDDDGVGYYATDNAKSNIIAYPSDFKDNQFRTDFTHIIWFNNIT